MKNVFLCTAKFLIFILHKMSTKNRVYIFSKRNVPDVKYIKKLGKNSISYEREICKAFFKAFFYAMKKSASHGNFSVV